MVWAGVGYGVKTPLFFIPEGVKVDGPGYREFLRKKVLTWARRMYGQREWVFMQDGAPSHKAEETQNLIRGNVPEFIEVDISSKRDNGDWPPNSPDLNLVDFSIWSILKAEACSKPHQSIEALKKSSVAA
uniref:Tc1-like transposase DDE domain-containing protein n=1 Tax=Acrobeloides nanus TaxID=290746 RepID=A0A914DME6_9BILA